MKAGDKVRCINSDDNRFINTGSIYTVDRVESGGRYVIGDHSYPPELFELAVFPPEDWEQSPAVTDNNGGSTDYYKLPPGAKDLQDLIEFKKMNFSQGNIFKATYRLGAKNSDLEYDLNKIIWFAQRMLEDNNK